MPQITTDMDDSYRFANSARPSARQIEWQKTEFYALVSYGLPVFTSAKFGGGYTSPSVFWPENMDTDSWCELAVNAGMRGLVFTCKHYDGFCLWPTAHTDYSVKNSNWMDGEGDLVRMVADSCRKFGLKFGIYVSPWDMHEKTYGTGVAYDDYFCNLLTELLTNYGDVFCVWLDGICGSNETRVQKYDWGRYYQTIRTLAPNAVISFMGPDVRWSGNENGVTRSEEWSSVPAYYGVYEDGTSEPAPKKAGDMMALDIGSRKAIKGQEKFIWYPCEVSLPIRKHWFFDEDDKYSVKTKDKLLGLYFNSVGNNSCLMLGLSPNKRGVIDDVDTQILTAFGKDIKLMFSGNIVDDRVEISASSEKDPAIAKNIKTTAMNAFWRPEEKDRTPVLHVRFKEDEPFDKIVLSENIANGQHIEAFEILYLNEKGKWKTLYEGTTVGYKRICNIKPIKCRELKFIFTKYRDFFELSHLQIN